MLCSFCICEPYVAGAVDGEADGIVETAGGVGGRGNRCAGVGELGDAVVFSFSLFDPYLACAVESDGGGPARPPPLYETRDRLPALANLVTPLRNTASLWCSGTGLTRAIEGDARRIDEAATAVSAGSGRAGDTAGRELEDARRVPICDPDVIRAVDGDGRMREEATARETLGAGEEVPELESLAMPPGSLAVQTRAFRRGCRWRYRPRR